jgi:hypothetical protein
MDHGDLQVHHGLATIADLGLTSAMSFGRSGRWEFNVRLQKERGGLGGSYLKLRWVAKRWVPSGNDEQRRWSVGSEAACYRL